MGKYTWLCLNPIKDKEIFAQALINSNDQLKTIHNDEKTTLLKFIPRNTKPFNITVEWNEIEVNEFFSDQIFEIALDSYNEIPIDAEEERRLLNKKEKNELKATIVSIVNTEMYKKSSRFSNIEFASKLIYAIITRHKLENGNKRTAIFFGLNYLNAIGLFVVFLGKNYYNYEKEWESFLIDIATNKHSETKALEIIRDNLLKNIRISFTLK